MRISRQVSFPWLSAFAGALLFFSVAYVSVASEPAQRGRGEGAGGACSGGCACSGHEDFANAADQLEEPATALSPEVRRAVETALADEYRAEAFYEGVMEQLGEVRPFANVVRAERRHAASLASLLERRSLPVPAPAEFEEMARFSSRLEACAASVQAEVDNAAIYDEILELDLPKDVRRVFEHNRFASLEHHLPAFQRCASGQRGHGRKH